MTPVINTKGDTTMSISKFLKVGMVGLVVGIATGFATADDIDLQARLEAAEARIAELSASDSDNWLNDRRAEETRQLVHDVLADADTRASMQGDGKNPVTVNVHGFLQTRWMYNDTKQTGVDATHGFDIERARISLTGKVYDWGYKIQIETDGNGDINLADAYATWDGFTVGQFKAPFMKEVLTSASDLLAVDRSIISNQFGQGRSQGVQYGYDMGFGGLTVAYTDGFNTANGAGVQNGYALTGRLDFDATDWLSAGVAVSHNDMDTYTYNTWTADASVGFRGVKFTGAYVATMDDTNGDGWGTVWTASYTAGKWQPFAQYERGHLDGVAEDLSIATLGVTYNFNDNVKWTTDLGYSLNTVDAGWNTGRTGWNTSASEGETLIRSMVQVKF
jgi:hypothetical protein